MSIIKYSSGIVVSSTDIKNNSENIYYPEYYNTNLVKSAKKVEELSDDYIYSVVIGIQGDIFNENNDYWPWEDELLKQNSKGELVWKTWIDKPNCIDHKCASVMDHYGRVADCWPNYPPKQIMMVTATSKSKSPELARGIDEGHISKVSMSCEVGYSVCSYCGKKAYTDKEYCVHVIQDRGRRLPVKKGAKHYEGPNVVENDLVRVGEICFDSNGRELSWVSNPAFTGCKSVSKLKLANKLDIIAEVYNAQGEKNIASAFKKIASKDIISFDEKKALKLILDKTGKSLYKAWIN